MDRRTDRRNGRAHRQQGTGAHDVRLQGLAQPNADECGDGAFLGHRFPEPGAGGGVQQHGTVRGAERRRRRELLRGIGDVPERRNLDQDRGGDDDSALRRDLQQHGHGRRAERSAQSRRRWDEQRRVHDRRGGDTGVRGRGLDADEPPSVTGTGTLRFASGTTNLLGAYLATGPLVFTGGSASFDTLNDIQAASLILQGGTGTFNRALTTGSASISGGTLSGTGDVTVSGPTTWTGG